nr:hypothetical protein [Tanacetum cinerariifolium]
AKTKVIKEESKALGLVMINDDFFTCDTPLGMIFNEFNRLSKMDDDLFTYEVKIPKLSYSPSVEQQMDDLDNGSLDIYERKLCYDECEKMYDEEVIFVNKRLNALWIYWTRGDDEEVITDDELSNLRDAKLIEENKFAQIFRIDTDIFHFETPLCEAFKEFNYLLKIDMDILIDDIPGFKIYDEYKDAWIYQWNKDVPWVANMRSLDYGPWMEPNEDDEIGYLDDYLVRDDAPFIINEEDEKFKERSNKPTRRTKPYIHIHNDGIDMCDCSLPHSNKTKDETIQDKKELNEDEDDEIGYLDDYLVRDDAPFIINEEDEKFKEIRPAKKYVAIKECGYDDWMRTEENVSHVYQDIFHKKDEGWFVTRTK